MIKFTQAVGVAPGTTTMQMGGAHTCLDGTGDCPADELLRYTVPPVVTTLQKDGTWALGSHRYFPYSTLERLKGLRGLGDVTPRWGLVLLAGLSVFAGVVGYRYWHRR